MEKSLFKSRIILQLEDRIKQYGDRAVEEIIFYLKQNGSPIIEELENDTQNSLVTFIYRGDKDCRSVLFVPDIELNRFKDNYKDFQMQRIMDTELWYITYEVGNNLMFLYYFSPNDPLDDNWDERFSNRVKYDKFNKNVLIFDDENKESKGSYVKMPMSRKEMIPWVRQNYNISISKNT